MAQDGSLLHDTWITGLETIIGFRRLGSGTVLFHGSDARIRNPEDAVELGIALEVIRTGLANFAGIGRRLQSYGEIESPGGPVLLIE